MMDDPEDAGFLCGLEGTTVNLDLPFDPPSDPSSPLSLHLSRQTWVIENKLSERSVSMTEQEVIDGDNVQFPYAAAKFLCHPMGDPSKKAFMRIYLQIPFAGTQYQSLQIRRQQAVEPRPHPELTTLKALNRLECDVVPDLLAYPEGKQGDDGIVPGGFITYVVWDKVPGEPLHREEFWKLDPQSRQAIRDKFREAFP